MFRDNRVVPVDHQQLPTPSEAVNMYRENGGTITEEYEFGVDPLKDHPEKVLMRRDVFSQRFQFNTIFHSAVNGNESVFIQALLFYIDVTHRLSL